MRENLSKGIKSAIDQVIYHILCYEDDCDLSQYEVYVRHDEHKLIEYKLTMGEIVDEARDELESLEKKYEIVLGEEIINMQMKKKLVHLKFKHYIFGEWKVVKGDEITRESGCVDDINIEIEDPFKEVEDKEVGEDRVLETRPQNDYFQIVEEYKVVGDLIEVDHIEVIIPEHWVAPPSLASRWNFASQLFFKKTVTFLFQSSSVLCGSCLPQN